MKTLLILLIFFSLAFAIKFTNEEKNIQNKTKEEVNLMFTKMYKHRFNTL